MSESSWIIPGLFYYGSLAWLLYYDWKIAIPVTLMCGAIHACRKEE